MGRGMIHYWRNITFGLVVLSHSLFTSPTHMKYIVYASWHSSDGLIASLSRLGWGYGWELCDSAEHDGADGGWDYDKCRGSSWWHHHWPGHAGHRRRAWRCGGDGYHEEWVCVYVYMCESLSISVYITLIIYLVSMPYMSIIVVWYWAYQCR